MKVTTRGSFLRVLLYSAFFLLPASWAPVTHAQGDASLAGRVIDTTGAAIPNAAVQIASEETGAVRSLITDDAGRFNAASLPVGHYSITVTHEGFRANTRTGVTLVVGERQEIEIALQVGDVHQTVEVPAMSGALMVTTEDTSGLVGEREVKELPLNGRSYDQLVTLNPGVVNYTSQRAG